MGTRAFDRPQMDFQLPWYPRLSRYHEIGHPSSIAEFGDWPDLDDLARFHLRFLEMCEVSLRSKWLDPWKEILAIGPFLYRQKKYNKVSFVVVANYRRPYRHLLRSSQALADPYLEFGVLPDIHLLPARTARDCYEFENRQWMKTTRLSVYLGERRL